MNYVELRILLSGRVQGVGFRYFTKKNAESLDVRGWVKNLPSGDVEAQLQGEENHVDQLIEKLKKGPMPASVDELKVVEKEKIKELTENRFGIER